MKKNSIEKIKNESIRKMLKAGKKENLTSIFIDTAIEELAEYIVKLEQTNNGLFQEKN